MAQRLSSLISWIEMLGALLLGLICVVGLLAPLSGGDEHHGESAAWAFMGGLLLLPLALSLGVSGWVLRRGVRWKWAYQFLPIVVFSAVTLLLYCADRA